MLLDGLIQGQFELSEKLKVLSPGVATLSTPSRGVHAQKICWTTAPCLVSTLGYPGERSEVGPFCLSQYPRQAEVRVTAGSSAARCLANEKHGGGTVLLTMVCLRLT